jgi:hypothetical protein
MYCGLVQTLVFVAPKEVYQSELGMVNIEGSLQIFAKCLSFSTEQAKEVILMVAAFNTFANMKTVIIGQHLRHLYSAKLRKNSLAKHSPTMILAASVTARVTLRPFVMTERRTGTCHGIKPRILNSFLYSAACMTSLKTLSLSLTSGNYKPQSRC